MSQVLRYSADQRFHNEREYQDSAMSHGVALRDQRQAETCLLEVLEVPQNRSSGITRL